MDAMIDMAMVAIAVEVLDKVTPAWLTKKKYAVPMSVALGFLLVAIDSMVAAGAFSWVLLWDAVKHGFRLGMSSGGAYSALKNYGEGRKDNGQG